MMLVIGSRGQLGAAILRLLGAQGRGVDREEIDLTAPSWIHAVLDQLRPEAVFNCAAYTNVDGAEANEKLATVINGEAVGEVAGWAAAHSIPFITFSTDYVFAGDRQEPYLEDDEPQPINAYGRSKRAGEVAAFAAYPDTLLIRTSWLSSGTHPSFLSTILAAAAGGPLRVVDDQLGRPTFADDLARAAVHLVGETGIVHVANEGVATWFELAQAAVVQAGMEAGIVQPCTTAEFPRPAARPAYSVLGSTRADQLGVRLPAWQESLVPTVKEIQTWL